MDKKFRKTYVFHVLGLPVVSFGCHQVWQQEVGTAKVLPQALPAGTEPVGKDGEPLFVVNSLMLYRSFKLLTRTKNENLHAVTGSALGRIRSLEQVVPVALSTQGIAGAAAENQSLANELILLSEFGLTALANFHSHPGRGAGATRPSSTDRQTQATIEQSGSDIIGGIFSRDGYVRFYANNREPDVHVVGTRITRVERNVYRLEIEENVPE
jgi:hypothetical protein